MTEIYMTGLEFAAWRNLIGLNFAEIAEIFGVAEKTVRNWESDRAPVPFGIAEEIMSLAKVHEEYAEALAKKERVITVSRDKSDFQGGRGRGWYVAALSRALTINPDLMAEWDYDN
ncbi:Uncharacterised protein [Arcanobacterium haemolyticum]|uniref:helix-turn-helix domain-containing protein n=1 Tax=Arcanobacterium haemolyticum TaxID=28264 RepID=UPI000D93A173|nr:DUF1870 family protein [Arcanobacterium haemolyticum]SPT75245.1 Uncharacterised protein [Arcanobacterium haemolyticum]